MLDGGKPTLRRLRWVVLLWRRCRLKMQRASEMTKAESTVAERMAKPTNYSDLGEESYWNCLSGWRWSNLGRGEPARKRFCTSRAPPTCKTRRYRARFPLTFVWSLKNGYVNNKIKYLLHDQFRSFQFLKIFFELLWKFLFKYFCQFPDLGLSLGWLR